MSAELVTLGETMALLTTPTLGLLRHSRSLDLGVAGAESNVAIGVRRLGGSAAWVGRVGDDEFGRMIQMALAGEGVDATGSVVDPGAPTGVMIKERRTTAMTRVRYYRSGSAGSRLCPDDVDEALFPAARIVHVTGITPALSGSALAAVDRAVELAHRVGALVSFDLNYRSALWPQHAAAPELTRLAGQADILFATEQEASLIVDAATPAAQAAALAALGPRQVLVKRGERGVVARIDGETHEVPARPVTPVDPVGAGDAFAAAYLTEVLRGEPAERRLATATTAGAFAVTVPGDWEGLPFGDELLLLDELPDAVTR